MLTRPLAHRRPADLRRRVPLSEQQRTEAESSEPGDMTRLSLLLHEHINMTGRYDLTLPKGIIAGQLRPLRDPTSLVKLLAHLP